MLPVTIREAKMAISESMPDKRTPRVNLRAYAATVLIAGLTACGSSTSNSGPIVPVLPPPPVAAATNYVDLSVATSGAGTQASPWNNLTVVDSVTFSPGDQLFFKRGMTCSGTLSPQGSETTGSPIVIHANGTGAQPTIDGGMNMAAVQLTGQQGWEINNLEIVGGNKYGIDIAGPAPNMAYTHFRLTNLNVHGARYLSSGNDSGEVVITIGNAGETFNDIVIDGVTTHIGIPPRLDHGGNCERCCEIPLAHSRT
jgi:hypothetical protein